jgi:hypothetical protein
MHNPRLVVITFADDPNRSAMETFGQWIGGSSWLTTVGADYGVGAGTLMATVERTDNAPNAVTNTDIESMIAAGINAGTIPSPTDADFSNVLYMVFYPQHTVITLTSPGAAPSRSCQGFEGYHSEVRMGTVHVAYAAVPDCGGFSGSDVPALEAFASHEYIEAATDPQPYSHPAWEIRPDGGSAWNFIGGEVGDLCELTHSFIMTEGHYVQRIWSNTAAAADHDPCIPADPTRPYFNVSVDPGDIQYVNPGDTVTFTLTGWSLQPMANWTLQIDSSGGSINLDANLSDTVLNNGRTATFTLTIPDDAPSNSYETFLVSSISSSPRARQVLPLAVVVN